MSPQEDKSATAVLCVIRGCSLQQQQASLDPEADGAFLFQVPLAAVQKMPVRMEAPVSLEPVPTAVTAGLGSKADTVSLVSQSCLLRGTGLRTAWDVALGCQAFKMVFSKLVFNLCSN